MIYNESDYDKTKYFLDSNKQKIYAKKGSGHKDLAYDILFKTGLNSIYARYEDYVPATEFLTYCCYVLVDEAEETIIQDGPFAEIEVIKFTTIAYCSASISEEYIEYLKNTYTNPENVFDDSYKSSFVEKKTIDEIIEKAKRILEKRNDDWER